MMLTSQQVIVKSIFELKDIAAAIPTVITEPAEGQAQGKTCSEPAPFA